MRDIYYLKERKKPLHPKIDAGTSEKRVTTLLRLYLTE